MSSNGDGQHNGGVYFWGNLNPYIYTYQNPIKYIDPNGKQTESTASRGYRSGIPIPMFKRGDYYTPFPRIEPVESKVREGVDITIRREAWITAIKLTLATLAYQKLKQLFADKFKARKWL
ncbi:hypothetical protein [Chryseobacterium oryctis]|uniref:RHS repeat-associated core domain-containing protein n=1 Tax=Chryseobacterium oryctis TaxID=2952618 RepID=A0ABT3HNV4_9FLAO|nr:hypothetical protein [Chryseobacterium oryctis]MCW3161380.1 hypothetical protein [Chryseobacterium oryctis]